jgi:hypothetical protein
MHSRTAIHDRFVARFHFGSPPVPACEEDLDQVEAELNTKLPNAYRQFMTRHGKVYTPDILRAIVDQNLDHVDLQNIDSPKEAIEGTKGYWSAGMPPDVIAIANDCMGNMIGFHRHLESLEDAPVIFFDHDFIEVYPIEASFDALLLWFLDHL